MVAAEPSLADGGVLGSFTGFAPGVPQQLTDPFQDRHLVLQLPDALFGGSELGLLGAAQARELAGVDELLLERRNSSDNAWARTQLLRRMSDQKSNKPTPSNPGHIRASGLTGAVLNRIHRWPCARIINIGHR